MKKILYFVPAILFILFFGMIIIATGLFTMHAVYLWIGLFVIGGILLSKGRFWGGLLGILPGIHLMVMSTIDTGQILPIELPLGIFVALYYGACCLFVFFRGRKMANN